MKLRHLDSSPPNVGKLDVCSDANDRASMAASTGIGGVATGVGVGVGNANGVDGGVTGGVGLGVAVAAGVDARAASEPLHAISSATVAHRIARIRNIIKDTMRYQQYNESNESNKRITNTGSCRHDRREAAKPYAENRNDSCLTGAENRSEARDIPHTDVTVLTKTKAIVRVIQLWARHLLTYECDDCSTCEGARCVRCEGLR